MASLRTEEAENKYQEHRKNQPADARCPLCFDKETLKSFKFWKIVENIFPYDRIAQLHHMIIPIRHVSETGLNPDELHEFKEIKDALLHTNYEFIIEATYKMKSIPEHFHLHLIVTKF